MSSRTEQLLHSISPSTQLGLEVGALMTPVVTPDMGRIRYLDHEPTGALREKYASHRDVDIERIVEVDYVWTGTDLADLVGPDGPFDYLVASHVLEHIPDPLTWLNQVRAVLRPGGIVSLALPDKRYSFDADRSPSVTADLIDAFLRKPTAPGPRQVFDHHAAALAREGRIAWTEHDPESELTPVHSLEYAWELTQRVFDTGDYQDVHCWVFTPESFRVLMDDVVHLGLIDFEVERVSETSNGEFFVTLRAGAPSDSTRPPAARSTRRMDPQLADALADRDRLAAELRTTTEQLRDAIGRLAEMRSSTSWRLTAPVRVLGAVRLRLAERRRARRDR